MPKSRMTIVGLGLIGGSIGLALKSAKLDLEIVGHDKDSSVAGRALKRGAVDKTEWNLINACEGAGMIILAIPLDGIKDTLAALKPYVQPGVIITDTATTKAPVLEWAKDLPQGINFVGGHPVLKADRIVQGRGIEAADATLFQGAKYCLTPSTMAEGRAIDTVASLATALGAKPYFMEAVEHDGLAAGVRHLPALLATAYAAATMSSQGWRELGRVATIDYRTATELVPQDPRTAREQFLAHRTDLTRWIDILVDQLKDLRGMIDRQDGESLEALVKGITDKRDQWLAGKLEDTGAMAPEADSMGNITAHFFLGSLADRSPKKK